MNLAHAGYNPLKPTKKNNNNSQLWSITALSKCVSRETGRRHLLSEMWRSGPGHLLAHCLRTTEQLSVCVHMFACVCICVCVCVMLRDIPYLQWAHPQPDSSCPCFRTPSGTAIILLTFIIPSFEVFWLEKKSLMWHFGNVSTMFCLRSPLKCRVILLPLHTASVRGCWEKKHTVIIIISQSTES